MKLKHLVFFMLLSSILFFNCNGSEEKVNIKDVDADVDVNAITGLTVEQANIKERIEEDNKIGAIKYLYVISAYSGEVILYSTVAGKVTSSGKRLNPYEATGAAEYGGDYFKVKVRGETVKTPEVPQDDGTFGHSIDYLLWWDTKGVYHQHYVSGGQIVHVSSQPLSVKRIMINLNISSN